MLTVSYRMMLKGEPGEGGGTISTQTVKTSKIDKDTNTYLKLAVITGSNIYTFAVTFTPDDTEE